MKKKCIVFTVVSAIVVAVAIVSASHFPVREETIGRMYLENLGYIAEFEESDDYTVPTEPDAVFEVYNKIQQNGGFDLAQYKGEVLMRYTYHIPNYGEDNVYANVLIYKRQVVGGDISQRDLNGFMLPLGKQQGQ